MDNAISSACGNDKPRFSQYKIGIYPLPLFLAFAAVVAGATLAGKLPPDMIGGLALLMLLGPLLCEIGFSIPVLKDLGGPAIFCIFVPSALVYYGVLSGPPLKAMTELTKTANWLYLIIASLVAGSLLGMNRQVLIQGFMRMFVPLAIGTVAACAVGVTVGSVLGLGAHNAFFYIVIPIISGGIGEGVIPLSLGYSEILAKEQSAIIPMIVPAAMIGNVTAIMLAGYLRKLGLKKPHLSGDGKLVKIGDEDIFHGKKEEMKLDLGLLGIGSVLACCLFIAGGLLNKVVPIPGAVLMILLAALAKVCKVFPAEVEKAAYQWYQFVAKNWVWPVLVALGAIYTPWQDLISVFSPAYVLTVVSTVAAMVSSGFFLARFLNMYPVESAIVTACHSGLGGTGDVAILSASDRMVLMPFAQISTRIGGACMVIVAIVLMRMFPG